MSKQKIKRYQIPGVLFVLDQLDDILKFPPEGDGCDNEMDFACQTAAYNQVVDIAENLRKLLNEK